MRRSLSRWVRTWLRRIARGLEYLGPVAVFLLAIAVAVIVLAYPEWGLPPTLRESHTAVVLRVAAAVLLAALAVGYRRRAMRKRGALLAQPLRLVKKAEADDAFYEIGVEREAGEALELLGQAGPHAPYVPRAGDDHLRERITGALGKWGVELIVIAGPPTAGKSRTLAVVTAAVAGKAWLIVPRDADAVAKLARDRPPVPLITWHRKCVVWLDDIERFVRARDDGLNEATIKEFSGWRRPVVLLGTAGGKGLRFGRSEEQHAKVQGNLLRDHQPHTLSDNLSEAERGWMRDLDGYGDPAVALMTDRGIAEFMVAATRKRLLLDVPSEKPVLGVAPVARALRDIVVQSEPRFAVGIFGGWGSGKTTLMQAIETRLEDRNIVCVRFVAWRYEKEEHLIVPLLDAIREALVDWAARNDHDRAARETAATVGKVVRSILAGVSLQAGLPGAMKASFEANKSLQEYGRMRTEEQARRVPRSFYHASFMALKSAFEDFVRRRSGPADRGVRRRPRPVPAGERAPDPGVDEAVLRSRRVRVHRRAGRGRDRVRRREAVPGRAAQRRRRRRERRAADQRQGVHQEDLPAPVPPVARLLEPARRFRARRLGRGAAGRGAEARAARDRRAAPTLPRTRGRDQPPRGEALHQPLHRPVTGRDRAGPERRPGAADALVPRGVGGEGLGRAARVPRRVRRRRPAPARGVRRRLATRPARRVHRLSRRVPGLRGRRRARTRPPRDRGPRPLPVTGRVRALDAEPGATGRAALVRTGAHRAHRGARGHSARGPRRRAVVVAVDRRGQGRGHTRRHGARHRRDARAAGAARNRVGGRRSAGPDGASGARPAGTPARPGRHAGGIAVCAPAQAVPRGRHGRRPACPLARSAHRDPPRPRPNRTPTPCGRCRPPRSSCRLGGSAIWRPRISASPRPPSALRSTSGAMWTTRSARSSLPRPRRGTRR